MKALLTGSPGTGKTTLARLLARHWKCPVLNEKDIALEEGIGSWDHEADELAIPLEALARATNRRLRRVQDAVVEGHLYCEARVAVDVVVVVRVHPEELELRLQARRYPAEKLHDNVFCEGIDYCLKHARRTYPDVPVVEVANQGAPPADVVEVLLRRLREAVAEGVP